GTEGLIDTIYQSDFGWGTNVRFGFSGHDMMIQWFEAPANLTIIDVGINVVYDNYYPIYYDIKLVKSNWSRDELINSGVNRWGYYYEPGNSYNDAAPLISELSGNTDTVWIAIDSSNTTPIWDEDLCDVEAQWLPPFPPPTPTPYWFWGRPYPVVPMVGQGDIFGVVIYNTWPIMNDHSIKILASTDSVPYGGFKYYADGRFTPGVDYGWWSREYAWDMAVVVDILSDIEESNKLYPETYTLNQNYPNPFNTQTKIEYSIPKAAKVEIIVFDILGREVAKLVNETKQ
ncbi:MAG: T9SS type A sorting domain-containing protein, partial [Gammaproteobacteria bacterium]|nr:T9SS type A sorting domain-containing protein [Gammaproteobacteria bacterium]